MFPLESEVYQRNGLVASEVEQGQALRSEEDIVGIHCRVERGVGNGYSRTAIGSKSGYIVLPDKTRLNW